MNSSVATAVVVLKSATLALGGSITFYTYRAARDTGSSALRTLAIGFGTVTLGAILAGVVDLFLAVESTVALVAESLFTTAGFVIILYSLYVTDANRKPEHVRETAFGPPTQRSEHERDN